jgi:hypothetical protein
MKNLITIIFLALSFTLSAQAVRTTVTSDGTNVTITTPVNSKVIPVCDFHWIVTDGILKIWIEGGNEIIPGGRLGNFTISGATTQAAKLAALGVISAQCTAGGGGGGLSTLYYGNTLLADGDTIPSTDNNGIYTGSGTMTADATVTMGTKILTFNGEGVYNFIDANGYSAGGQVSFSPYGDGGTGVMAVEIDATGGNIQYQIEGSNSNNMYIIGDVVGARMPDLEMRIEGTAGRGYGFRVDSIGPSIIVSGASTNYPLAGTLPSTAAGDSSIQVVTGNPSTAVWMDIDDIGGGGAADGNGIYTGDGTAPADVDVAVTDSLNFDAGTLFINGTTNRVGIGVSSTLPSAQLSVRKDNIGVTQSNAYGIVLANNTPATVGAQQMSPGIRWMGNGWKTTATAASQTVDFLADVLPVQGAANPTGTWQLKSSINGGAYSTLLNATSDGSVGIGIVAPAAKLDVYATVTNGGAAPVRFSGTSSSIGLANDFGVLTIENRNTTNNNYSGILFSDGGLGCVGLYGIITDHTNDYGEFAFASRSASGYNEKIRISSGGLLGIGTTSPDRLLHAEASDAATNTTTYAQRLTHITSGTATTGFGVGTEYELETADGANDVAATEEVTLSDATAGSEDATYTLKLIRGGALTEAFNVSSVGTLTSSASLVATASVRVGTGSFLGWPSSSLIYSPSNGVILLQNNATSDFSRLQFGGTTSSFPSLKRSSAALAVRLADDSADADFTAARVISTNVVRLKNYTVATLPAGTQGDMAFVTDANAPTYLGALVGGGAVVCPVFYNGTAWVSH